MKKRLSGWIETAKSMVMILLFACVLILLGVYIALLSDTWTKDNAYGGVVDKIHLLASGEHTADYPDGAYLLPETILFRDGETSRMLCMSSDGAMLASYTKISALLTEIFSNVSSFRSINARSAAIRWEELVNSDLCLYVSYHSELPAQIIGYFTAALTGTALRIESAEPILVQELAICKTENGEYLAMLRASNGALYACSSWNDPSHFADLYVHSLYELEKLSATVNAFVEGAFSAGYSEDLNVFSSSTVPVLLSGMNTPKFRFSAPYFRMILDNKENTKAFLQAFSYNPNKINRHEEASGTSVFVEEHGMLKISDSVILYTAAQNGGISASVQLGADASDMDLYNAVLYATRILDRLRAIRPQYFGGDCELILHSVSGKNGQIEIRFRYYADNLLLRNQPGEILFVFASDTLISAEITGLSGYNVTDADHIYSGAWAAERFHSSIGTIDSMAIVYDYSVGAAVSAQWIATAAKGNGDV